MILTGVDFPAPFSPRRARTVPPVASRSTPRRTSTPPNDLRIPRARSRKRSVTIPLCLAAQVRVVLADVLAVHSDQRHVEQLGRLLAGLDRLNHVGDPDPTVLLWRDSVSRQPVRIVL